jgi:hypothetical protein
MFPGNNLYILSPDLSHEIRHGTLAWPNDSHRIHTRSQTDDHFRPLQSLT